MKTPPAYRPPRWTLPVQFAPIFALCAALTGCGNGGPSAPIEPTPTPLPVAPPPEPEPEIPRPITPTNFRVTGWPSVGFTWKWDGVDGVDGYHLQVSQDEVFTDADRIIDLPTYGNPLASTGLYDGSYPWDGNPYGRIRSYILVDGEPLNSEWSSPATPPPPPPLPPTPTNFRVSVTEDRFTWTWDPVEDVDGYYLAINYLKKPPGAGGYGAGSSVLTPLSHHSMARMDWDRRFDTGPYARVRSYICLDERDPPECERRYSEWSSEVTHLREGSQ